MRRTAHFRILAVAFFGLLAWGGGTAHAASLLFSTPAGSQDPDKEPVSATALITPGTNQVTVTLTNLQANPTSAGQLVSDVIFSVSGATGAASLTASSGNVSTIFSNGTTTPATLTSPLSHWGAGGTGTVTLETAGSFAAGGAPNQMIIGPGNSAGLYTNANPSITNNHNPSVIGSATFTLTIPGVTSSSIISNVQISFGTGPDFEIPTGPGVVPPNVVPEPASLALLSTVLLTLGGFGWRRKRR